MNEGKRGYKTVKHMAAPKQPEVKRRNPVAKNAGAAIGGGAAGAHKDKKKAVKQGDTKHKKRVPADMLEGQAYEKKLEIMLKMEGVKSKLNTLKESSDLAAQFMAMAKAKGMNARLAGTPDEERARTQQMMAQRAKDREASNAQAAAADAAKLPELKAEYDAIFKKYNSLGGRNWQYADREQNLSDAEREARSLEPKLNDLSRRIHRAEKSQGVAEGSKKDDGDKPFNYDEWKKSGQKPRRPRGAGFADAWEKEQAKDKAKAQGVAENFDDGEPEGETLKNSLHTIIRVATHLDRELDVRDDFPEWVSEKVGAVKGMMVGVMDYLISDQEMQQDPDAIGEGSKVDRQAMHITKSMMKRHGMSREEAEAAAWAHIKHPKKKKKAARK